MFLPLAQGPHVDRTGERCVLVSERPCVMLVLCSRSCSAGEPHGTATSWQGDRPLRAILLQGPANQGTQHMGEHGGPWEGLAGGRQRREHGKS